MKKWVSQATPLAAIASLALTGAAWAGGTDDFGCSNAALKGLYAFGVTNLTTRQIVAGIKVSTATAISHSVITQATAFPLNSHHQDRKQGPTRSIPTARAAW